ncbi:MAG: hypothetical protein AB1597_08695 [Chloroflexota bacterium]
MNLSKPVRAFLAVGLVITVAFGLMPSPVPVPVSAVVGLLEWGTLETPGKDPFTVISPSEANQFALYTDVDGNITIYLTDIPNSRLLKSTDGGSSWLTTGDPLTTVGAVLPAYMVAVAPDDSDIVVAVTNNRKRVYYSIDGGVNWATARLEDLVPPLGANEQISGIEISSNYLAAGGYARDIVICTRDSTPGPGRILLLQLLPLGIGAWKDQLAPAQGFSRLRLSPNYASDQALVAVGSNATDTFLNIGIRDFSANTSRWNAAVTSGWPVDITGVAVGPNWTQLITSDIVLPNDYYGQNDYSRRAYICFDDNNATGQANVYYVDNYTVYKLNFPEPRPYSLAGNGSYWSIELMCSPVSGASLEGTVPVYYCARPSPSGGTVWTVPYKYPSGGFGSTQTRAVVRWTSDGSKVYAGSFSTPAIDSAAAWYVAANWTTGTANDESALSISIDDGLTWNQVGYIDTTISGLNDFAVSPDGGSAYVTSWNLGINLESIWRTKSVPLGNVWERVRCTSSTINQPIVRLVPKLPDGSIVFWADVGGRRVQRSQDGGQTWQDTQSRLNVQDMALVNAYSAYVLQNDGRISKGSIGAYGGMWVWGSPVFTGITTGHTISVQGDTVVVGGSLGSRVTYSLDGGSSFQVTPELPTVGNQHVAIDPAFRETRCIYVADDSPGGQLYRWYIGVSGDWNAEVISDRVGPRFGIVVTSEATQFGPALYCPMSLIGGWVVERTLYPRVPMAKEARQSWDYLTSGLPVGAAFASEPSALKISSTSPNVVIWAVDTSAANRLLAFNDSMTLDSTVIIAPKLDEKTDTAVIPIAPNGYNVPFGLGWDTVRTSSEYEAQISATPDFSDVVASAPWAPPGPPFFVPANPERPSWLIGTGTLMSGKTYYARVRVRRVSSGQEIRTVWSPVQKMTLQPRLPVGANYAGPRAVFPAVGALDQRVEEAAFSWSSVSDATEYHFVLGKEPSFDEPLVNSPVNGTVFTYTGTLEYGTTYFWQVWATKPAPSEKSPVFIFTTVYQPEPKQEAEIIIIQPDPTPLVVVMPVIDEGVPPWGWVLIGVSGLLLVTVIVAVVFAGRH